MVTASVALDQAREIERLKAEVKTLNELRVQLSEDSQAHLDRAIAAERLHDRLTNPVEPRIGDVLMHRASGERCVVMVLIGGGSKTLGQGLKVRTSKYEVLETYAVEFDPAPPEPTPTDLVHEVRDALGLYNGASPRPPKVMWEEALRVVRRLAKGDST